MPNYISKKAIDNFPISPIILNQVTGARLRSKLLKPSEYLNKLANNELGYNYLKNSDKGGHIQLIKAALNTIKYLDPNNYTVELLDATNDKFDDVLENAVNEFKNYAGIISDSNSYGKIDSKTLLEIDDKLVGDIYHDNQNSKYLGKSENIPIEIVDKIEVSVDGTIDYIYTFKRVKNGEFLTSSFKQPLRAKFIKKDGAKTYVVLDSPYAKIANFNDEVFEADNTVLKVGDTTVSIDNLEQTLLNTPPLFFNDPDHELYPVQDNDTFTGIVEKFYYNNANTDGFPIENPYIQNGVIFNLPNRSTLNQQALPSNLREHDARFQFYMNLIYYYNSVELDGNQLQEWGIKKKSSLKRYSDNHLDAVNVFNNTYDSNNPESALPNYYRFLKEMESLEGEYKINFDSAGNTTSFETQSGKNLRIPSRKYADSLYYYLNYRPKEMQATVSDSIDFVEPNIFDTFLDNVFNAIDSIVSFSTELKDSIKVQTIHLYNETRDFFIAAYNFITELSGAWPRGMGGELGYGGSITWGIPIKTKMEISKGLWRKVSEKNELTFVYTKDFELGVGADIVGGYEISIGQKSGVGKKPKSFGITAAVGAGSLYSFKVTNEYEFPIRKGETALLTMIVAVFGGKIVENTANVISYLTDINLDPRQYLTKFETTLENQNFVWAVAQGGLNCSNGTPIKTTNHQEITEQNTQKSYGSIDNIWQEVKGIGVSGQLGLTAGLTFSYQVDYGNNPFTSNGEGRVFEKINMDIKAFTKFSTDFQIIGSFLQRIFANALPFNIDIFNVDKGVLLGMNYQLIRISSPDALTKDDFKFLVPTLISGNAIKYDSNNVKKQINLYFGTYSGDAEALCIPGSEFKLTINPTKLYNLVFNSSNFPFNFDNVYQVFYKMEYHKKVGVFSYDKSERKKLYKNISDKETVKKASNSFVSANSIEVQFTDTVLRYVTTNINSDNIFADFGLALDVKMEINFDELGDFIKYFVKRLFFVKGPNLGPINTFRFNEKNREDDILKKFNDNAKITGINEIDSLFYYEQLYSNNFVKLKKADGSLEDTNLKGLLNLLEQQSITYNSTTGKKVIIGMFNSVLYVVKYLNHNLKSSDVDSVANSDYGIKRLIDIISVLTQAVKLTATLEAKAGGSFEAAVKAGEGATAGASLSGFALLTYRGTFIENGLLTIENTSSYDPLHIVYNNIKRELMPDVTGKKNQILTVFSI